MNWDEKADDYAVAHHTYEHLSGEMNQWHYVGINKGARWQREQLRTDEAVERAAEAIWARNHGPAEKPVTWQTTLEEVRELWREDARAVIAALNQEKW